MASFRIPFLVTRRNKDGSANYYWQPSKTLADAGWHARPLGRDEAAAIDAAREINRQVERWREGEALPKIRSRPQDGTLAGAIADYTRTVIEGTRANGTPRVGDNTARTYRTGLKRLETWGGKFPLAYITRQRVRALRDGMMKSGVGEHAIHNTLKMGRQLFAWLIDEGRWEQGKNPFEAFGMAAPDPRQTIWSPPARELIVATADRLGFPSIALAVMLGYAIGQREADILETTIPQWVALPEHKMQPEDHAVLAAAAPDGVPRGIRIRQIKTGAWIEVPVVGEVRRRVEANIARARAAGRFELILDDTRVITDRRMEKGTQGTLAAYEGKHGATRFQRDFAEIREAAAASAAANGDEALAAEIRALQFRDLRRTCVVYLGELGLEDHLIAAITGHDIDETRRILKVYMPRTTGRAARAIALVTAREAKEAGKKESNR
jgi:hypothetical protein